MEDGPARRTRSATSTEKELTTDVQGSDPSFEDFKTPAKTPKKYKIRQKARTPSGQILTSSVKDIRDFFQQNPFTPLGQQLDSQSQSSQDEVSDSESVSSVSVSVKSFNETH